MKQRAKEEEERGQKTWQQVLEALEARLTAHAFETWFGNTRALAITGDRLIVEVPNEFYIDWLEEHYTRAVREALHGLGLLKLKVVYRPRPKEERPTKAVSSPPPESEFRLQKRYTFETFVVGKSNEFASAAAKAVAQSPSSQYNPLFLYGGVGLGKTHLLQALGYHVLHAHRNLKVFYSPTESFMNEMVKAIQTRGMVNFKAKYRQVDVLLFDDIQFLADKEMLQEEVFHTFNSLYDAGRQLVMTSDRPPREIPALEERLVSRFQWGLVADIQPPDLETRMAILRRKADEENLPVPDKVIHFIAQKVKSNIRELEGCLNCIKARYDLTQSPITIEAAEEMLRDIVAPKRGPDAEDILEAVSKVFLVSSREIRGQSRKAEFLLARQIAMYLLRSLLKLPLQKIGTFFGGRDHSTVLHSLEKMESRLGTDPALKSKVEELVNLLRFP